MDDDEDTRSQSNSPPPPLPPPFGTMAVTVASGPPPLQTLTLALPIQHPRPSAASSGGAGREDCWSEGATSALVDSWGERYLDVGRGSLRQHHWQEVADAVTARDDYTKPPKTEAQCKNRIDTLKKKYKAERVKPRPSSWPFFDRLHFLLSAAPAPAPNPSARPARHWIPSCSPSPSPARELSDSSPPVAANGGAGIRASDGITRGEGGGQLGELARAMEAFGEMYERVEKSRLDFAKEAERKRMDFVREVELERMRFFAQVQKEIGRLGAHGGASNGVRGARSKKNHGHRLLIPSDKSSNHKE